MPKAPHSLLLTCRLLGLDRDGLDLQVTRTVEVPATMRLVHFHDLIQKAFGWGDRSGHVFADMTLQPERPDDVHEGWPIRYAYADDEYAYVPAFRRAPRRRLWEMDHWCRDRDPSHVSECEWTATIGSAMESVRTLYYEYGTGDGCDERSVGACALIAGEDDPRDHEHGWVVAITGYELTTTRRSRYGTEPEVRIVDGAGRTPIEACGGASGYRRLVEAISSPSHPRHGELDAWARGIVGPWAAAKGLAFDPRAFSILSAQASIARRDDGWPSGAWRSRKAQPESVRRILHDEHRFRRDVVDELVVAVSRATVPAALPDEAQAIAMTESLASSLRRLPSSRTKPLPSTPADIAPAHDQLLRTMRLAYRRNGVLLRGRAGDDAIADPRGLLNRCADGYWKLDGVGKVDLYAALAVAEGWSGSALVERVAAAAGQDVADARPAITRCLRELETACGSTAEPITGDTLRAFASLVLSR